MCTTECCHLLSPPHLPCLLIKLHFQSSHPYCLAMPSLDTLVRSISLAFPVPLPRIQTQLKKSCTIKQHFPFTSVKRRLKSLLAPALKLTAFPLGRWCPSFWMLPCFQFPSTPIPIPLQLPSLTSYLSEKNEVQSMLSLIDLLPFLYSPEKAPSASPLLLQKRK